MLTINELNEIETVFIMIDSNNLNPELANSLIEYFHDKKLQTICLLRMVVV